MSTTHQMYRMRMAGHRYGAIARRFGLTIEVVYRMIKDFERVCLARMRRSLELTKTVDRV